MWLDCNYLALLLLMINIYSIYSSSIHLLHQLITSSDKGNMFACDQCQYKAGTKGMLKIHHNHIHQVIKYICDTCGHQTLCGQSLRRHQEAIHDGKKYACRECDHQATSKGNITQHQQTIHGLKYPCRHKIFSDCERIKNGKPLNLWKLSA